MNKALNIKLDEETHNKLLDRFAGDESALARWAAELLKAQVLNEKSGHDENLNTEGLEEYLKNKSPGSRSYGVKGQGW